MSYNRGMDETVSAHPGLPQETYHKLGKKTLWIFIMQRIHLTAVLLFVAIALLIFQSTQFAKMGIFGDIQAYATLGAWIASALFLITFALTALVSWLIYANYKFYLGEDSLKIKRGILNKEEIAIPYRQIQDVDIERDLAFQMMGLSRIIILTAGHEDDNSKNDESEGILPAMDRALAEWLQVQLLEKANVQKVTEEPAK